MAYESAVAPKTVSLWRAPIVLWAGIGAISMVFIAYVLTQWVAAGVTSLDPGTDPITPLNLALIRFLEWSQFIAMIVLIWVYVIKPTRTDTGIGFDGLLVLAALALNFWDPLDNYLTFAFQYNAHYVNVRSWGDFFPGWASGPDVWAVPVLFVFGAYTWAFVAAGIWTDKIVKAQTARGRHVLFGFFLAFWVNAAIAAVSELIYLQTNSIANLLTPNALTLWSDQFNGWPLYNPILFGLAWTAVGWLRWSRDGEGLSYVERGVAQLARGSAMQVTLRFLAIFAFLQVSYILLYFTPWNLFTLLAEPMPPVPSWFPLP